jgi:hypothetical protein
VIVVSEGTLRFRGAPSVPGPTREGKPSWADTYKLMVVRDPRLCLYCRTRHPIVVADIPAALVRPLRRAASPASSMRQALHAPASDEHRQRLVAWEIFRPCVAARQARRPGPPLAHAAPREPHFRHAERSRHMQVRTRSLALLGTITIAAWNLRSILVQQAVHAVALRSRST